MYNHVHRISLYINNIDRRLFVFDDVENEDENEILRTKNENKMTMSLKIGVICLVKVFFHFNGGNYKIDFWGGIQQIIIINMQIVQYYYLHISISGEMIENNCINFE